MKYAVEVASCGSINKAAESLYMDQSNLSRCIKDLEASLGVNLFERSSRGIKVTPRGEEFLKYAKSILKQVDTVENMFRGNLSENKKFSVSVPRASYISDAFSSFIGKLPDEDKFEFFIRKRTRSAPLKTFSNPITASALSVTRSNTTRIIKIFSTRKVLHTNS